MISESLPAQLDIRALSTDTFKRSFTVTDGSNQAFDFQNTIVKFNIVDANKNEIIMLSSDDETIQIEDNIIKIHIDPQDLSDLEKSPYMYKLIFEDQSGDIRTWLSGLFIID
jgi:hypothetical protein